MFYSSKSFCQDKFEEGIVEIGLETFNIDIAVVTDAHMTMTDVKVVITIS